jgi:hypothetical protein
MTFLGILSYVFSRSIKTMCKSFFCSLYFFINCRSKKIKYTKFVAGALRFSVVSSWRFGQYTPRVVGRV